MAEKQYDSTVSFQGKRLAQIQFMIETIFRDSFLWIKVDHYEKMFIIYLDDKSSATDIQKFESENKQCKIKIFREISLQALLTPSGK